MAGQIATFLFGSAAPAALPARVARQIEWQQQQAEILIGWVQALIIVVFGGLYLVARKTIPAEAGFQPVPWALAFYALFTVARVWIAHRRSFVPLGQ